MANEKISGKVKVQICFLKWKLKKSKKSLKFVLPKNYQKITSNGVKKSFRIFFSKRFPEKTFRKKLSGKIFPAKKLSGKIFRKKLSGKKIPEKNFWKKLSGKTFRLNFLKLFFKKRKFWKAFPKNFPKFFYIASRKNFLKTFQKNI